MNLKNKKILVTGGTGFIGTSLIIKLKELGANVDNFDKQNGNDIQNNKQVEEFIKNGYDIIFHLAGFSGSAQSNKEKLKCLKINLLASVNLYELILRHSPKTKVILSSSRLEYGPPKYLPVDENHPTNPTSMYGLTKLTATQMALVYHNQAGLNVTIFRTSNVYGPHKNKKFQGYNLINHFIDLAEENKSLTIFGNGEQKRDYLYIDDLTEAFIMAASSKKSSGEIFNLGSGTGIEIKEMAQMIIKKIGKGRLKYVKWPIDYLALETGSYVSDIKKIKRELGFAPRVSLEEGIIRTLREF